MQLPKYSKFGTFNIQSSQLKVINAFTLSYNLPGSRINYDIFIAGIGASVQQSSAISGHRIIHLYCILTKICPVQFFIDPIPCNSIYTKSHWWKINQATFNLINLDMIDLCSKWSHYLSHPSQLSKFCCACHLSNTYDISYTIYEQLFITARPNTQQC